MAVPTAVATLVAVSTPKRHHYVPRFYLSGFAEEDGSLYAHDLETGVSRPGTTETEGVAKHFYRMSGGDESRVERALSEVEGHASAILREMQRSRDLPCNRSDYEGLLFFVALQSQRVIRTAEAIESWFRIEERRLRGETTEVEDRAFRLASEDLARDGYDPVHEAKVSKDYLQHLTVDGVLRVDRDAIVGMMMDGARVVHEQLLRRTWMLLVPKYGVPDFITSDSPVNAVHSDDAGTRAVNVGYHLPDRMVVYPISRRLGLIGYADRQKRVRAASAGQQQVGFFNWAALMGARRFAWSRRPRVYHVGGEGIHNDTTFMVSLRKRAREQSAEEFTEA